MAKTPISHFKVSISFELAVYGLSIVGPRCLPPSRTAKSISVPFTFGLSQFRWENLLVIALNMQKSRKKDVSRQRASNQLNIVVYVCGEEQKTTHEESWPTKKGLHCLNSNRH